MPFKRYRSKRPMSRKPSTRRRLQPVKNAIQMANTVVKYAPTAIKYARKAHRMYKEYYAKKSKGTSKIFKSQRVQVQSDNIVTIAPTVIGTRKPLTFDEKVSRVERAPILFKRNYEFSAECGSGRKSWFSMECNQMNTNDLGADLTTYRGQQFTDSVSADPTIAIQNTADGSKFYVDFLKEKLSFINSSTNALTGKIHLFAHRRDNDNAYGSQNVPITPINMMMFYSANRLPALTTANEATLGNGWEFDTATSKLNYTAVYNMPGSALNAAGVCAETDHALSFNSPHLKDSMQFWFRHVNTIAFDLKPGQQINKVFTFHDLKDIMREEQANFIHIANVSYSIVVEFQGQIVGSNTTSDISTGFTQLSVMRQSTRQIGVRNKLKSKIYLITAPPAVIGTGPNQIVNADLGDVDVGVNWDTV